MLLKLKVDGVTLVDKLEEVAEGVQGKNVVELKKNHSEVITWRPAELSKSSKGKSIRSS